MEATNAANEFVGSPIFISIMISFIVIIAVALRLTFRSTDREYKHRPDE